MAGRKGSHPAGQLGRLQRRAEQIGESGILPSPNRLLRDYSAGPSTRVTARAAGGAGCGLLNRTSRTVPSTVQLLVAKILASSNASMARSFATVIVIGNAPEP